MNCLERWKTMIFNFRSQGTVNAQNITSLTKGISHIKKKKAIDITQEILKKFKLDGLNINDCLPQGYENTINMLGIHSGVQALIKNIN